MTHAKFYFNWLMLTLIFGIWASEPPRAWRTTEKAGPDRVKSGVEFDMNDIFYEFKYLHHFQDGLTFGVKAVLKVV